MKTISEENLAEIYEELLDWFHSDLDIFLTTTNRKVTSAKITLHRDFIMIEPKNSGIAYDYLTLGSKINIESELIEVIVSFSGSKKGYFKYEDGL